MTRVKRTALADAPTAAVWVSDPWGSEAFGFASDVHAGDYPTHSPILGPDGRPLEYEPRLRLGFDLKGGGNG